MGTRCLAIDLRGYGDSDAPSTGYSVDDMADDVAGVIEYFGLSGDASQQTPDYNYILVGHSMSGKVALALAARRLAGMRNLVLFAPSPPSPEPIPDETRNRLLATHGEREAAERTFQEITMAPLAEAIREQIIEDNLRTAPVAWDAWLTSGSREDITDRMGQIETMPYIAVGEKDSNIPVNLLQQAVLPLLLAGTSLQVIPGVGHLLPSEAPEAVVAVLEAALAEETVIL